MLRQNQGHNQTIQRQGFTENQHNQHTHIQLVGGFRGVHATARSKVATVASHIRTTLTGTPVPLAATFRFQAKATDPRIAQHTNGAAGRQTRETATQTRRQLIVYRNVVHTNI